MIYMQCSASSASSFADESAARSGVLRRLSGFARGATDAFLAHFCDTAAPRRFKVCTRCGGEAAAGNVAAPLSLQGVPTLSPQCFWWHAPACCFLAHSAHHRLWRALGMPQLGCFTMQSSHLLAVIRLTRCAPTCAVAHPAHQRGRASLGNFQLGCFCAQSSHFFIRLAMPTAPACVFPHPEHQRAWSSPASPQLGCLIAQSSHVLL